LFEADPEIDVGGVAAEPGGDGVEERSGAGAFGGADADRATGVDGGEAANCGVVGVDDLAAVGEEFVAVVGEAQVSSVAADERAAGAFLESFEFPTHGGAGEVEVVGGGLETAGVGEGLQGPQRIDVELHRDSQMVTEVAHSGQRSLTCVIFTERRR